METLYFDFTNCLEDLEEHLIVLYECDPLDIQTTYGQSLRGVSCETMVIDLGIESGDILLCYNERSHKLLGTVRLIHRRSNDNYY